MVMGSVESWRGELFRKDMVCIAYNVEWRKGQVGFDIMGHAIAQTQKLIKTIPTSPEI